MVQIVPGSPNAGGNIGSALGSGLSSGLQALIQHKMNQMTQQQQLTRGAKFWEGLGLAPDKAIQFASAPEAIQKSLLDRLEGVSVGTGDQMQPQGLNQLLGRQEGFSPNELQQALSQEPQQEGGLRIGANPMERRHKETLAQQEKLAQDKREFEREKLEVKQKQAREAANRPVIKGITEDFTNYKKIYSKSKEMLDILKKNKDKWPDLSGYIPEKFHRDPDVRRYLKYKNQLTSLLAGARKGQPTNFKVKLEQQSGPELTQPFETQEAVLQDFLDDAQEVFKTFKDMSEITKSDPSADLGIELGNRSIARLNENKKPTEETFSELPDASKYPGKIATNPSTGKKLKSVNGQWQPIAA